MKIAALALQSYKKIHTGRGLFINENGVKRWWRDLYLVKEKGECREHGKPKS